MKLASQEAMMQLLLLSLLVLQLPVSFPAPENAPCSDGWLTVPNPNETTPALVVSRPDLKPGRMTIYEGPLGHLGHCGYNLGDIDGMGMVALSPRYLGEFKQPRCGDCVCVRVISNDKFCNRFAKAVAEPYYGKVILKAKVGDRCGECEPDHVDVLLSPAFTNQMPVDVANQVGIFWSEWDFVDCNTDCNTFFASGGPTQTPSPVTTPTSNPTPNPSPSTTPSQAPGPFQWNSNPSPVQIPTPTPSPIPAAVPSPILTPSPIPSPIFTPSPFPTLFPSPSPAQTPATNLSVIDPSAVYDLCPVKPFQQCGGLLTPPGVDPALKNNWLWEGYCCPRGQACVYRTDTFWQCLTIR